MSPRNPSPVRRRGWPCALLVTAAAPAWADPAAAVFTPYGEVGKWELAYGLGTARARDGARESQQTASVGGTPSARWYTAVYAAWAASDGGAFALDEWSWTTHLKLTESGAGPVDIGLLCELARPHDRAEGRLGLACGPTLQMDTDDLQLNFDAALSRYPGAAEPAPWQLGYQWQAKGMVARGVELGAQGFGALGPWTHWSSTAQQEHTAGPAIFLKTVAGGSTLRLDAAWLLGIGPGSPRHVVRLRLQQEF